MQYDDQIRALTVAVVFAAQLAGHYVGDHWVQTCAQACKKPLDAGEAAGCALWSCAKHVLTWTATIVVFAAGAVWWLNLSVRPGWVAASVVINAVTHFVIDLRTPMIWVAEHVFNRAGYIDHVQVVRPVGAERTGPGTAVFHLDQAAHIAVLFVGALVAAGPA